MRSWADDGRRRAHSHSTSNSGGVCGVKHFSGRDAAPLKSRRRRTPTFLSRVSSTNLVSWRRSAVHSCRDRPVAHLRRFVMYRKRIVILVAAFALVILGVGFMTAQEKTSKGPD